MKLDFDNSKDNTVYNIYNQIALRFVMLEKFFQIYERRGYTRQTKHGIHVTIEFKSKLPISDKDIVFMQTLLGSDWKREIFNWKRVRSGLKNWNVLFNKKFDSQMKLISREKDADLSTSVHKHEKEI